jgi:DNA-binding transcriptional regulator WhiA
MLDLSDKRNAAYVVGVALGDGNLSNPNGRAVRLRITCDKKYPYLITKIEKALRIIAPQNRVGRIDRDTAIDVYCYSNGWEEVLGWKAKGGPKFKQSACVPDWIMKDETLYKSCLCGLFETDGSVYKDRKYTTVNFVTQITSLAGCVEKMMNSLGYVSSIQKLTLPSGNFKFTFRVHKEAENFIKELSIQKR